MAAKDKATNKEQNIRIESSGGMSKDEVEKMKSDAQKYGEEDKKRKEEIDLRNQADALVYSTDKQMKDLGDKMTPANKEKIEAAKTRLANAIKDNPGDIRSAMDELNNAWSAASSEMYQGAGQGQNPGAGQQQEPKKDDGVEEAEYTVVDDETKKEKE